MKKILIICSGGLSTEIISQKLNTLGSSEGYEFTATDVEGSKDLICGYDGVMITPQTKYLYKEIAGSCQEQQRKAFLIPFTLYSPNPTSVQKLYAEIKSFF